LARKSNDAHAKSHFESSALRRSHVIARAGTDLQTTRNHLDLDFVVANLVRACRRVAQGILRVQFSSDFVNGLLNRAILKCGEMSAARGGSCDLERVIGNFVF